MNSTKWENSFWIRQNEKTKKGFWKMRIERNRYFPEVFPHYISRGKNNINQSIISTTLLLPLKTTNIYFSDELQIEIDTIFSIDSEWGSRSLQVTYLFWSFSPYPMFSIRSWRRFLKILFSLKWLKTTEKYSYFL